jgi:hypothetical protein
MSSSKTWSREQRVKNSRSHEDPRYTWTMRTFVMVVMMSLGATRLPMI